MENKIETVRQYLDRIGIMSNDDSTLVIEELWKGTEMQVSRRYLESEPMKHILDMIIVDYKYPHYTIYGSETIKLFVESEKK